MTRIFSFIKAHPLLTLGVVALGYFMFTSSAKAKTAADKTWLEKLTDEAKKAAPWLYP